MNMRLVSCSFVVGLLFGGCAGSSQAVAREASIGAIHGYYEGVASVPTGLQRKVYRELLSNDELHHATRDLARWAVLGAGEGLGSPAFQQYADRMGVTIAQTVSKTMPLVTRELRQQLRPMVQELVRAALLSARTSAEETLGPAIEMAVRHAVHALMTEMSKAATYDRSDRPVPNPLARAISYGLAMGMQDSLKSAQKTDPTLIRAVSRQAAMGIAEGLGKGIARSPLDDVLIWLTVAAILLAVVAVIAAAVLWRRFQLTTQRLLLVTQRLENESAADSGTPKRRRDDWAPRPA